MLHYIIKYKFILYMYITLLDMEDCNDLYLLELLFNRMKI